MEMELDLIEFLEEKNFTDEDIYFFQKKLTLSDEKNNALLKKIKAIYKIFGIFGLHDNLINALVINNYNIVKKSDQEIMNIAYVWASTGLLDEICEKTRGLNAENYVRTYLRNKYLNSELNKKGSIISHNALTVGDNEFQNIYYVQINGTSFYPTYENLVSIYGRGDTYHVKEEMIKKAISIEALSYYRKEFNRRKNKGDSIGSV